MLAVPTTRTVSGWGQSDAGEITTPFTFLDFFSGPGGLSLGFAQAGFAPVLALDKSRPAVATYRRNIGPHAMLADMRTLSDFPRTTVIVGGPPCQGFSSAGLRREGDERNSMVVWFARVVARLQPTAFVFENVEGFLTGEDGAGVLELVRLLVGAGYRIHLRKINAANYGVPQHRKRVVAIGGLGWSPSFPEATHAAYGAPGARLAGGALPLTPAVIEALEGLPPPAANPPGDPDDHFYRRLTGTDLLRARALGPGQRMRDLPEALWHESYRRRAFRRVVDGTPTERRGGAPVGLLRLRPNEPSKAITSGARSEFLHPMADRNLTLRECARIQTFPDSFRFEGTLAERAQLVGDAVPPRLAYAIATSLAADLSTHDIERGPGALLSFMPTLASGMSPKLAKVADLISSNFGIIPSKTPAAEQLALWR